MAGANLGVLHHEIDLLLGHLVVAEGLILQQQGIQMMLMHLETPHKAIKGFGLTDWQLSQSAW